MTTITRNDILAYRAGFTFESLADRLHFDLGIFLVVSGLPEVTRFDRLKVLLVFLATLYGVPTNAITLRKGEYKYAWAKKAQFHALPQVVLEWLNGKPLPQHRCY